MGQTSGSASTGLAGACTRQIHEPCLMRLARSLSSPGTQAARIVARLHVRCLATRPAVQQVGNIRSYIFGAVLAYAARDHCGCFQASPEVVQTEGIPVLLYAPKAEVEPEALKQLVKLAESGLPVRGTCSSRASS